jgi:hypothetical protein
MANMYINAMSALWNNGATVYSAIKMNVSRSASAAGSKLIDLQVNGAPIFNVDYEGNVETKKDVKLPSAGVLNFNSGDITITHTPNELTFGGGTYIFDGATTLLNTTSTSTADPILTIFRDSASPAAADAIGAIDFAGKNALTPTAAKSSYAYIGAHILDTGDATGLGEDGELRLAASVNGTLTTGLTIQPIAPANTFVTATAPRLRLTATDDAAYNSTGHAFQVGADASTRIIMDRDEFQSYNGAAASSMYINGNTVGWNGQLNLTTFLDAAPNFSTSSSYPSIVMDKVWQPAVTGYIGRVLGRAKDSANNPTDYCGILFEAMTVTSTVEMGKIHFQTAVNGTPTTRMTLDNLGVNIVGDCDLTTTLHVASTTAPAANTSQPAFAIGTLTGTNLAMGPATIMARNNGALATLTLNTGCSVSATGGVTAALVTSSGDIAANGGLTMGSNVVSTYTDLTKHLSLYGTTYGINITSAAMNFQAPGTFRFCNGATAHTTISSTGFLSCIGGIDCGAVAITAAGVISGVTTFTASGYINGYGLRLTNINDCSATSTAHAFQIGDYAAANVIIDNNEIWARSNGVVQNLGINGSISLGGTGAITCASLTASGAISGSTVTATSDESLKQDIKMIDPVAAHRVMLALHGYHFKWTDSDRKHSGMLAQEVIKAGAPELVFEDEEGKLSLNYNGLLAYVAAAYHYQEQRLDTIESRLERAGL